jgi:hypothetical protein
MDIDDGIENLLLWGIYLVIYRKTIRNIAGIISARDFSVAAVSIANDLTGDMCLFVFWLGIILSYLYQLLACDAGSYFIPDLTRAFTCYG